MPSTFYDMRRMAHGKQLDRDDLRLVRMFSVFHPFVPTDEQELVPTAQQALWDLWVKNRGSKTAERQTVNAERQTQNG